MDDLDNESLSATVTLSVVQAKHLPLDDLTQNKKPHPVRMKSDGQTIRQRDQEVLPTKKESLYLTTTDCNNCK